MLVLCNPEFISDIVNLVDNILGGVPSINHTPSPTLQMLAMHKIVLHQSLVFTGEISLHMCHDVTSRSISQSQRLCVPWRSYFNLPNGNPLQCFCLENPMNRGAWWATVHRVAKSRTRLSDFALTLMWHHESNLSILCFRFANVGRWDSWPFLMTSYNS